MRISVSSGIVCLGTDFAMHSLVEQRRRMGDAVKPEVAAGDGPQGQALR